MTVIAIDLDPVALTLTIVAEFDKPAHRVWQVWADPPAAGTLVGTADPPRHRRRPRSDCRRPGHLLHDRAGRREAPRVVAHHLGRPTSLARVR